MKVRRTASSSAHSSRSRPEATRCATAANVRGPNVLTDDLPVVALMIYGKNEQGDLVPAELKVARRIVDGMVARLRATEKAELQQRRTAK